MLDTRLSAEPGGEKPITSPGAKRWSTFALRATRQAGEGTGTEQPAAAGRRTSKRLPEKLARNDPWSLTIRAPARWKVVFPKRLRVLDDRSLEKVLRRQREVPDSVARITNLVPKESRTEVRACERGREASASRICGEGVETLREYADAEGEEVVEKTLVGPVVEEQPEDRERCERSDHRGPPRAVLKVPRREPQEPGPVERKYGQTEKGETRDRIERDVLRGKIQQRLDVVLRAPG